MRIIFKICLILLSIIILNSCSSYSINSELKRYSKDMVKYPNKLWDLRNNYPEIFNDNIISDSLKKGDYIRKLYDFIIKFDIINYKDVFGYAPLVDKYFIMTKEMQMKGSKEELYLITFKTENGGIEIIYFYKNNKWYLFSIEPFTLIKQ